MQSPVPGNDTTDPKGPNWSDGFSNQTVRQVIRVSSGGSQVRVRLSNLYGTKPLKVAGATIARTRDGATVEPGTLRSLTFHGARSATISAGRVAASDPAAVPVAALESLTITRRPLAVANSGISGNTLLNGLACFGEKGITRFRRDALGQPGVRTVIFGAGTNDIWDSEGKFGGCGQTPQVTADQLIAGYQTLIRAAHARGVRIIGATIIPFKAPYMSPADFLRAEAIRDQANHWIRTSGEFDAVADFAKAVADPADPEELNPACNSGDFLHPNDAGYRAIAATIKPNEL
jgi:lysophospholipase L1-like esterase